MPILTDDERLGTIVGGGYRLERILGRGGMGVVYAATHARVPALRAAVKFLNATFAQNAEVVTRFMREAQAAAMLKHPNVVTVQDVGVTQDGAPYMMLEYLDGQSLAALLAERRVISPQEAMSYLGPVLSAVAFAHDSGIVHRDLKPDNIFLSRTGQGHVIPKVLDFGIAKLTREQSQQATSKGGVLGTPTYMAPEQAQGDGVGPWSDVWSMGVVLYEAMSGTLPWNLEGKDDVFQVLVTVVSEAPISLGARSGGIPGPIVEVVDRALSRDPMRRYRHARELDEAMKAAILRISVSDTLQPASAVPMKAITPRAVAPTVPLHASMAATTPFVAADRSVVLPPQRSLLLPVAGLGAAIGLAGVIGWVVATGSPPVPAPEPAAAPPPSTSAPDAFVAPPDAAVVAPPPSVADTTEHHHRHRGTDGTGGSPTGAPPTGTASTGAPPTGTPGTPTVGRSGDLIPLDE